MLSVVRVTRLLCSFEGAVMKVNPLFFSFLFGRGVERVVVAPVSLEMREGKSFTHAYERGKTA